MYSLEGKAEERKESMRSAAQHNYTCLAGAIELGPARWRYVRYSWMQHCTFDEHNKSSTGQQCMEQSGLGHTNLNDQNGNTSM